MVKEYLNQINQKETNPLLVSLRTYAEENDVPIIRYDGLQLLIQIIKLKGVKNILEIGSAIGYSSIAVALHTEAHITTIERNPDMIKIAKNNIKKVLRYL